MIGTLAAAVLCPGSGDLLVPLSSKRTVGKNPGVKVLRNLRGTLTRASALLVLLLLGMSALASAQADVPVSGGGITSLAGTPPIYNGQYVLKQTDFGFLWLDTVAMTGGLVQVEAKCGLGQPPPVTNLYVIGDCNGITDIKSTG